MKTVLYAFIAFFIFGILQPAFTSKVPKQKGILIQAMDSNASSQLLVQSAKIISGRLSDLSSEKFEVTVIPEKNQIQVTSYKTQDLETVEKLLTHKGVLAFYEIYTRSALSDSLKNDNRLFSMLPSNSASQTDAKIGCTTVAGTEKVNEYLKVANQSKNFQFIWDLPFEGSDVCLYALKTNDGKGALISGSDIESVKSSEDKTSHIQEITIALKKSAVDVWADATRRNLNHAIAIVLDDRVLAAPVVNSVIYGGKAMVTGSYTPTQARYIAAIGNNGELPLCFKVVK